MLDRIPRANIDFIMMPEGQNSPTFAMKQVLAVTETEVWYRHMDDLSPCDAIDLDILLARDWPSTERTEFQRRIRFATDEEIRAQFPYSREIIMEQLKKAEDNVRLYKQKLEEIDRMTLHFPKAIVEA